MPFIYMFTVLEDVSTLIVLRSELLLLNFNRYFTFHVQWDVGCVPVTADVKCNCRLSSEVIGVWNVYGDVATITRVKRNRASK